MVSRVRSTFLMGLLLALILSLASLGVVATPAQAATASTAVTITSTSPTMKRLNVGACSESATTSNYQVIKFNTRGVGNMDMGLEVTTSAPVTAMLYQGVFLPDMPNVNCYITAWSQPAGQVKLTNTGYNNSSLPDFPDQSWYLVLASDNPGAGVNASAKVTTSLGTVAIDALPVISPPTISTASLPDGRVGVAYSNTLTASGGAAPNSFSATGLPAGLSVSSGGVISGTPTVAGTFNVSATVTDAQNTTASKVLPLVIATPTIAISPATLPDGRAGASYSAAVAASGGTAPYTYAVTAGRLPAGWALNNGTIAGKSTEVSSVNFTITATDAGGNTGSRAYAVSVSSPVFIVPWIVETSAKVGIPVVGGFTADGGTAPYTFTLITGPPGLSMSSTGEFTGTPTASGHFTVEFRVTDSTTGVGAPYNVSARTTLGVSAPDALVITPDVLPEGSAGQAFSQQLSAAGADAFAVTAGALPAGFR